MVKKQLTPQELKVMEGLRQGLPYKTIAHNLNIGYKTVSTYIDRIKRKVGARSRHEILRLIVKSPTKVVGQVWNPHEGLDCSPCWVTVTSATPYGVKTYLVIEDETLLESINDESTKTETQA